MRSADFCGLHCRMVRCFVVGFQVSEWLGNRKRSLGPKPMRHLIWRFLFLAILLAGTWKSNAQSSLILLRRVTVIDAAGGPARRNVDVLIRGDHIERIARGISAPSGAAIIQAGGKFLIPGLWDMHVHIWDADLALPLFLANGVTGVRNMGGHPDDLKRWRMELREGRRLGPQLIACGAAVSAPA